MSLALLGALLQIGHIKIADFRDPIVLSAQE
jgi:hypothetical protein